MKTAAAALLAAGLVAATPMKDTRARGHVMIPAKHGLRPQGSTNATADFDSSNWSGIGFTGGPNGQYTSVTGTFTVPQPSPPSGSGDGTWYGCAWVGIDGDSNQNALFQGGIDWSVTSSGGSLSYGYSTWIEWIPDAQVNVDGMDVTSGDSITVTCTSSSSTTGTCYYTNNSNGQSTSQDISAPSSSAALQGVDVEWIVEDYSINGGLAPFADYGTTPWSGCSAVANGNTYGLDGGQIITLTDSNGNVESACSLTDNSDFTCNYE